jgi:class 3 adenylate cyclase/pimeloyl-ACP methyl ester carboxylesterase
VEPDIRYARNVDVAIAYQVVGQGDRDLVLVPDYMSNLVYDWESRYFRDMYLRFARSFRLILFDKRGTGLSDHGGGAFAALETRMEDLRAVLDAAGSERAVVLGQHEGGAMAALYAATYPERTEALVLFQAATEGTDDPERERSLDALRDNWGTQRLADTMLAEVCPTLLRSEADRLWFANRLRVGASPEVAYQLNRVFMETDLSDVLPAIRVPTLVLYRSDVDGNEQDTLAMSALIPDARVVRLAGNDYWGMFLSPGIVDEVESFVESVGDEIGTNSVLATLVFTDLADSTALAHRLGDRGWAEMVERHHAAVRAELRRFRGVEVDTAGDGFFATFDGPARAIRCGCAIRDALRELDLRVRVGIHTGECALAGGKPSGVAVSTAARVAATAEPGEVLISQTVKDLVAGSGIAFVDRGESELKGIPGTWRLYSVV